jgi:cobyrinic acid a,c-diamide synthase
MRRETLGRAAGTLMDGAALVVCEGVMGLFDGAIVGDGDDDGSTASLARLTGWPVVLVVDAAAQGASAAAVVKGFAGFSPDVGVAGVVFNRVGGERHAAILRDSCRRALPDVPVLGCLPRTDGVALPERHLGLVQAGEHPALESFIDRVADLIARHLDVEALVALARPLAAGLGGKVLAAVPPIPPLGQRIAVAKDDAFAFSYPLAIDGWREAGVEIVPFSPLADEAPDLAADAVYLPGGYPELHAGRLAAATKFLAGLRGRAQAGACVYGECGGYMTLGQGLVDAEGNRHAMAGLLALETSFAEPKLQLGYRRVRALAAGPLGGAGARFRGHEFHYAKVLGEGPGERLFETANAEGQPLGPAGLRAGKVQGSFVHLIDRERG